MKVCQPLSMPASGFTLGDVHRTLSLGVKGHHTLSTSHRHLWPLDVPKPVPPAPSPGFQDSSPNPGPTLAPCSSYKPIQFVFCLFLFRTSSGPLLSSPTAPPSHYVVSDGDYSMVPAVVSPLPSRPPGTQVYLKKPHWIRSLGRSTTPGAHLPLLPSWVSPKAMTWPQPPPLAFSSPQPHAVSAH